MVAVLVMATIAVALAHRVIVPMRVVSETVIVDGVFPPVAMISFPTMEPFHPVPITRNPDIAGSQIKIRTTNHPDVFKTVPDVIVRNHIHCHYWRRRRF